MSIKMHNVREFYAVIDMLLLTIKKGSNLTASVVYSGSIVSGDTLEYNTAEVKSGYGIANISATYNDDELIVKSTTSKKVAKWIMDSTTGNYKRVNNYLPFLDGDCLVDVVSIQISGVDIIDDISTDGSIDISKLSQFVIDGTEYGSIKYNLINGSHCITLIYSNKCFLRLVKLECKDTLYINSPDSISEKFGKFHIDEYFVGPSLPDLNTQINMYKNIAEQSGNRFVHVIS